MPTRGTTITEIGAEVVTTAYDGIHQVALPDGRLVWCQKGMSLDLIPHKDWVFSKVAGDAILEKIAEGRTVEAIGKIDGYPPAHVIRLWAIKNEEFRKSLGVAQKMRAGFFHDRAIETAQETYSKKMVGINKLKIETDKWAAEKGDPGQYGTVKTIVGDPDRPVKIVVDTGIRRDENEPIAIEPDFKEILE